MQKQNFNIGIILIILAAFTGTIGQLFWKFGTDGTNSWVWYILGFLVTGLSAIIMMLSFRYGEVSILQPLMSVGYVFSILLGYLFLGEPVTLMKLLGTVFIIIGAVILAIPDRLKQAAVVVKKTTKAVTGKRKRKKQSKKAVK